MPICPNGHQSGSDDWCEVCGHRMGGPAVPSSSPPPPGTDFGFPPPDAGATAQAELCPQCRTPREARAPFCEECRWNFLTNTATSYTPIAPPQRTRSEQDGDAGGGFHLPPGFQAQQQRPPEPYEYQGSRPSQVNRPAEPLMSESPQYPRESAPQGPPYPREPERQDPPFQREPERQGPPFPRESASSFERETPPAEQRFRQESPPQAPPFQREAPSPYRPGSPSPHQPESPSSFPRETPPAEPPFRQESAPPFQRETPSAAPPFLQQSAPTAPSAENDWMLTPPSHESLPPQPGLPQPVASEQQAPYAPPRQQEPPQFAGPARWAAVIGPDPVYFMAMMQRSGPEATGLNLPAYSPEQHMPLTGNQITIGRRRHSTGESPDIDLSVPPEDPGVSHQHAVLVQQPSGGWAVVDQNSTNGTTLNGGEEPIQPYVPIQLNDGDRVHVGAWTTIRIIRG